MQTTATTETRTLSCGHQRTWTTKGAHAPGEGATDVPTHTHANGVPLTTGTAHTPDGREICHPCAEREEVAAFAKSDKYTGYLSDERRGVVTTWTGAILLTGVRMWKTRSGFGASRWYFRGRASDGTVWAGSGPGPGMYCNMRRTKLKSIYA